MSGPHLSYAGGREKKRALTYPLFIHSCPLVLLRVTGPDNTASVP